MLVIKAYARQAYPCTKSVCRRGANFSSGGNQSSKRHALKREDEEITISKAEPNSSGASCKDGRVAVPYPG